MKKSDVLVIGGGAVGVAVAYYLAGLNQEVTLLEKDQICSGSSYGNAGLISCDNPIPTATPGVIKQGLKWMLDPEGPFYVKPRLNMDLVRWLLQFRKACREKNMLRTIELTIEMKNIGRALSAEFSDENRAAFTWEDKGRIILFRTRDGFESGQAELKFLDKYDIKAEVLYQKAARKKIAILNKDVKGALYYPGYSHVKPDTYVKELAKLAKGRGVNLMTNTEVLEFEMGQKKIKKVMTTRGNFQANQIVLAAGADSPVISKMLGIKIPIQPAKGYSVTIKKPANAPDIPVGLAEGKVAVTPMGKYLRYSCTLELVGYDRSINQRRIKGATQMLNRYFDGFEDPEIVEIWRGFRPNTPDTLPIIERNKKYPNLILATGHDMLGMNNSLLTGKLVSQIITASTPSMAIEPCRLAWFG